MTTVFETAELAALREHGFVLFAGRVIFEAQPPLTAAGISAIATHCAGPLPEALVTLWRHCAGGSLDYDLDVQMLGRAEPVSWCELFYDGSSSYHDLAGWIAHELELAANAASSNNAPFDGKLRHLPIGGFEYTDRVYAAVHPGAACGAIDAWKIGLPPAWTGALHEDAIGNVAPDLYSAFSKLTLKQDPRTANSDYFAGQLLLQHVDEQIADHGFERELANKLIEFYCSAHT